MSSWVTVRDHEPVASGTELAVGVDGNSPIDGAATDGGTVQNGGDVSLTMEQDDEEDVYEESDEAYQSRLSVLYQQALKGRSKSSPGDEAWEESRRHYNEILAESDPSGSNLQAKRLLETTETSANGNLNVLNRIRYLCFKHLGEMAHKENKLEDSLAFYHSAIDVENCDLGVWYKMATIAAGQQQLVKARHYLERALQMNPKHLLCLRRLVDLLCEKGINDRVGYIRARQMLEKATKDSVFHHATTNTGHFGLVSQSNHSAYPTIDTHNPFRTAPGGFAHAESKAHSGTRSTVWSNVTSLKAQREQSNAGSLASLPAVLRHEYEYSLKDVTFVGLGNLLVRINRVGKITKLPAAAIRIYDRSPRAARSLAPALPSGWDRTAASARVAGDAPVPSTPGGAKKSEDKGGPPRQEEAGSGSSRKRSLPQDDAKADAGPSPGGSKAPSSSNKKAKLSARKAREKGTSSSTKAGEVRKAGPAPVTVKGKRASKRLKKQEKAEMDSSQQEQAKAADIVEVLAAAVKRYEEFHPGTKAQDASPGATTEPSEVDRLVEGILGGIEDECTMVSDPPEQDAGVVEPADGNTAGNELGTKNRIEQERNTVGRFLEEMNRLGVGIMFWLQKYLEVTCTVSGTKWTYSPQSSSSADLVPQHPTRPSEQGLLETQESTLGKRPKDTDLSGVLSRIIALISSYYDPLGSIKVNVGNLLCDGTFASENPSKARPDSMETGIAKSKDSSKTARKKKKGQAKKILKLNVPCNVATGLGADTDGIMWLTLAEIQVDSLNRLNETFLGKGKKSLSISMDSQFYKAKKKMYLEGCKRCVSMMWMALTRLESAPPLSSPSVRTKKDRVQQLLRKTATDSEIDIANFDPLCVKRLRLAEHYMKDDWDARLRYYWLCKCWDKLEGRNILSVTMLRVCSTVLKERYDVESASTLSGRNYYLNHCVHGNVIDPVRLVGELDEMMSRATIDRAIAFYNEADKIEAVDADTIEQRRKLYESAVTELRNRYLPPTDSDDYDQDWSSNYHELVEDFFSHGPDSQAGAGGGATEPPSRQKRSSKRVEAADEEQDRPDFITMITNTCIGAKDFELATQFVTKLMGEIGKHGGFIASACSVFGKFAKAAFLPTPQKKSSAAATSHSQQVKAARYQVKRAGKFSLHLLECAQLISKLCPVSKRQTLWEDVKGVLPPFVRMMALMQNRALYEMVVSISYSFGDMAFTLSLTLRLANNCYASIQNTLDSDPKTVPKKSKVASVSRSEQRYNKRLTYAHDGAKQVQSDLLRENIDTSCDRDLVGFLQACMEVPVDYFSPHMLRANVGDSDAFISLYFAVLRLAVNVVDISKRQPPLRYAGLNMFFTFSCYVVDMHQTSTDGDGNRALRERYEYLVGVINALHAQLSKWGLTTARRGQLLKSVIGVLHFMLKNDRLEDGFEDDVEKFDFYGVPLGRAYFDVFKIQTHPWFETDTREHAYLRLSEESLSFCARLFEFARPSLLDESVKNRRLLLDEICSVYSTEEALSKSPYRSSVAQYLRGISHEEDPSGAAAPGMSDALEACSWLSPSAVESLGETSRQSFSVERSLFEMTVKNMSVRMEKNVNIFEQFEKRIQVLEHDLYHNPWRAQSWYELGDSASVLLNYELDRFVWPRELAPPLPQGKPSNEETGQVLPANEHGKAAFSSGAAQLSLVNIPHLREIARRAFVMGEKVLKAYPDETVKFHESHCHEQIGILLYNQSRKMAIFGISMEKRLPVLLSAFEAFEKSSKLSPGPIHEMLLGKLALKMDSMPLNGAQSNDGSAGGSGQGVLKAHKRALEYFKKAHDHAKRLKADVEVREGRRFTSNVEKADRVLEYTTYRLYASTLKAVLASHTAKDYSAVKFFERLLPGYRVSRNSAPAARLFGLLQEAIKQLRTLIPRSWCFSEHRPRYMWAKAILHGKEIAEAAGVNSDELASEWGAKASLEVYRKLFIRKLPENGGAFKFERHLVYVFTEDGKEKIKNTFDLLDMRQMKLFGTVRKKYIAGYIDLLEKCRALREMGEYLAALEKFIGDRKSKEQHFRPMVYGLLETLLNSISQVVLGTTGTIDPREAEETLKITYHAYLSSLVFAPAVKDVLNRAVVQAFDAYQVNFGAASKTVPEILQYLEQKWPAVKNKADTNRAKVRFKLKR